MLVSTDCLWLLSGLSGEKLFEIEEKVKAQLAQPLRYLIDHDVGMIKDLGWNTRNFASVVAANLWGKDEDGKSFEFQQVNIDYLLEVSHQESSLVLETLLISAKTALMTCFL